MTILDSSVWIAFFHEADSQHVKALRVFKALSSKILLLDYIILEVASVLAMRASKGIADLFLERVLDNAAIDVSVCDQDQFFDFCDRYRHLPDEKLSFVDSVLLSLSARHDVVTFDIALKRAVANRKRSALS